MCDDDERECTPVCRDLLFQYSGGGGGAGSTSDLGGPHKIRATIEGLLELYFYVTSLKTRIRGYLRYSSVSLVR
jgi:hypothetical protein